MRSTRTIQPSVFQAPEIVHPAHCLTRNLTLPKACLT